MPGSGSAASRISPLTLSSTSSIVPSFLADQGNETHRAEIFLDQRAVRSFRRLDELLHPARISHRHDDSSAIGQLFDERFGHMASACRGDDCVEGRMFGTTLRAV